jgi:transcriptional regulator with XRE-family HTH domain
MEIGTRLIVASVFGLHGLPTPSLLNGREKQYNIGLMSAVAEQLRHAREARRLTLEQVAEITKMRTDHLRALEEGNYNVFSAPVYIRGFVRSYSTLLKLDVPQVMAALDTELGQTQRFAEPPPLSGRPRGLVDFVMLQLSKIDWRKGVIGLGLGVVFFLAVVGYVGWRHFRTADPLKNLKPGVYQPAHRNSGETLPLPAPKR